MLSIWYDTDQKENKASNSSSIFACLFVVAEKCLPCRCVVTAVSSGLLGGIHRQLVVSKADFYSFHYKENELSKIDSITHSWSWALLEKLPIVQLLKLVYVIIRQKKLVCLSFQKEYSNTRHFLHVTLRAQLCHTLNDVLKRPIPQKRGTDWVAIRLLASYKGMHSMKSTKRHILPAVFWFIWNL
jgi:hypothetical protein